MVVCEFQMSLPLKPLLGLLCQWHPQKLAGVRLSTICFSKGKRKEWKKVGEGIGEEMNTAGWGIGWPSEKSTFKTLISSSQSMERQRLVSNCHSMQQILWS